MRQWVKRTPMWLDDELIRAAREQMVAESASLVKHDEAIPGHRLEMHIPVDLYPDQMRAFADALKEQ
jgi:hypothetical protein